MQAFKLNLLQKVFLSITALMFLSCGSFSPSSFVSSDGIYQSQEVISETNNGEFYKNYFKEKELELENNYELITESLDTDFISSSDIAYTENNARWGDIPDTKTLVFDFSRTYYNRYFGYGYGYSRPYMFGYGYYDYWNPYYSPWYSYSYWDPYYSYGRYWAWGYNPWMYYGWGYNRWGYNRWGYNRWGNSNYYENSYESRSYTNRNSQDVSYSKGRRGSSSGVIVYSSGRSSRMDDLISTENEEKTYNGRSVKSFDILVERDNGDIDKVRTYQTKPGSDDLIDKRSASDSQNGARIYLNRGSRFSDTKSSSRNYNQDASTFSNNRRYYVNPNSNSTNNSNSNRRYYANPNYNNNAGWRLSGKGSSNNINRSSSSGVSTRSYSNPGSSSMNSSTSTPSRNFSSGSISSPTRGSSGGSSSIGRGSSSSSGSSRGGGPR